MYNYTFKLYKYFVFLLCLLGTSMAANAQTGTIIGTVTTSDGKPAPFVNVIVKELDKGTIASEDGAFQLNNIREGNYIVFTKFLGLQTQEKAVHVLSGQTVTLSFILTESGKQLQEVMVTGYQTLNEQPTSIGKIAIKPMDLPQSVVTINAEVIERSQSLRLSDVLQNVNGVYQMGNSGGYQEELAGRGFNFGSSNTFKNGYRFNNGIMPEISALERVEVLKGSNAILFGNVAAGGVINLVTKKPRFENGGEVALRVGSYNFYKPSVDLYGSVNNSDKVAYRINTSYENAGSFRDEVQSERFYINPSLLFKPNEKFEVLLEGDYLKDERVPDYGIGAIDYQIPDVPRSRFIGVPWSNYTAEQKTASATITYKLHPNWQLRGVASAQDYSSDLFASARPNTGGNMVQPNGDWNVNINRSKVNENYYLAQLDLTGKFTTGKIAHNLLFGADADKYDTENTAFNSLLNYSTVNIFDPNKYEARRDIPDLSVKEVTENPIDRFGMYVQDLISLTEKVKLLAGVRYTYQQTDENENKQTDDAFTPRFGVVYQPAKTTSVFVSYANSFNLNSGIDVNGNNLAPSFVDQYEAGIKNDLFKGLLSANLTVYRIVNSNMAQAVLPAPIDRPTAKELAGEVTSRGVELDLQTRSFRGFSFIGGYSYNDTRYTKSNTYEENSRLRYNPSHTANASLFYTLSSSSAWNGLNLGLSSFYIGDRIAGRNPRLTTPDDTWRTMPVPDFFQFDAHAGYTLNRLTLRLKVSNLLNKRSYYVHDDNSINPIAPRMFSTTIAYKL